MNERNPHSGRYDFTALIKALPELEEYVENDTVNFNNPDAVLFLNKALLKLYYHVDNWMIPKGSLCPPIPGRADYIHYAADLLAEIHEDGVPRGKKVHVLDIGTGANCIYPIIGSQVYGWKFTATEIDPLSLKTARLIVQTNPSLGKFIKVIQQKQKQFILRKIIEEKDRFDLTICNPPFYSSKQEAAEANSRKWKNLNKGKDVQSNNLNFGGNDNELWCPGGEVFFIKKMMKESCDFPRQVCWFTTLVSKNENVPSLEKYIRQLGAKQIRIINMSQGNKISRVLAWSFLTKEEQISWS
ncbi:MAG: 23S rRNA (adenine(1618)-N(6))-methyltransferase RlmF [Spirochaetaceae bacterium]|nr:23S rRNA (adenine(1618)-N(6))-methyltransferase RlmF [Spirochaetaceae bacterium]